MRQDELDKRIFRHKEWLRKGALGDRLVIRPTDDIRGKEFVSEDLRCASFRGADLSNVCFYACELQNANFDNAIFNNTDFDSSYISYNKDLILRLAEDIKKSEEEETAQ